jgi:cephalosporin hydroxylase
LVSSWSPRGWDLEYTTTILRMISEPSEIGLKKMIIAPDVRKKMFDPLAWWLSRNELWRLLGDPDAFGVTTRYVGRGFYASIHAVQERAEIESLMASVSRNAPKVVVEIGTYKGGTLFLWTRAVRGLELIVSVDLPGGAFGGGYDARRMRLYREFLHDRPAARMEFLRGDSHSPTTLDSLRRILGGRPVDFLYIDGDHTFAGVSQDFEMYAPLVRRGGQIAFHDIALETDDCGVHRFWRVLKQRHRHEEYVRSNKGIGLIWV